MVSIIVPIYNTAKMLDDCITSIIKQTYKNIEIVLVNDESTDGSYEIAKSYQEKDERIKLYSIPHRGVSAARNYGLDMAKGDYIQFIDSDDHVEENMIEIMLNKMIETNADIVACNYTHPSIKNYAMDEEFDTTKIEDCLKYYQYTFAAVVPWNKLYKRNIITSRFDEEVSFCEDDLFGLSNLFNSKKLVTISNVLYHYYVAPKDTAPDELSCINKLAKADKFWETKQTYWYLRNNLLQKSKDIISEYLNNEFADDFAYARQFDFMIWEILILAQVGVDVNGLIIEMTNIFKEEEFKYSIKLREKYGISFKSISSNELDTKVKAFVLNCLEMNKDIENNKLNYRPFYCCMLLFAKEFIEGSNEINDLDNVASSYLRIKNNMDEEAKYVNSYIRGW